MKIRWYHMLVYRVFRRFWNPLFSASPQLCKLFADRLSDWHKT